MFLIKWLIFTKICEVQSRNQSGLPKLKQELAKIEQGFDKVGEILNIVGIPPQTVNQIVTVGKSAVTIAEGIGQIAAGTAILPVIGTIGGAIACIFGLFGGGPSQEQRMLSQIGEQIAGLSQHMDKRFGRLEEIICKGITHLANHIGNCLNELGSQLDVLGNQVENAHKEAMQQFANLGKQLTEIKKQQETHYENLNEKLDTIIQKMMKKDKKRYIQLRRDAFNNFLKNNTFEEHAENEARSYANKFIAWAAEHLVNKKIEKPIEEFSGKVDEPNITSLKVSEIVKADFSAAINFIVGYVNHFKKEWNAIVNPQFWALVANDYMDFISGCISISDKLKLSENFFSDQKTNIDSIIESGRKIQIFIRTVKSNKVFFEHICKEYKDRLNEVLNCKDSDKLSKSLNEFEAAYNWLIIFTKVAFSENFTPGNLLPLYLETYLWNKDNLKNCHDQRQLESSFPKNSIANSAKLAINQLEKLLLEKVAQAERDNENNYTPVDSVLEQLELFKQVYLEPDLIAQVSSQFEVSQPTSPLRTDASSSVNDSELKKSKNFKIETEKKAKELQKIAKEQKPYSLTVIRIFHKIRQIDSKLNEENYQKIIKDCLSNIFSNDFKEYQSEELEKIAKNIVDSIEKDFGVDQITELSTADLFFYMDRVVNSAFVSFTSEEKKEKLVEKPQEEISKSLPSLFFKTPLNNLPEKGSSVILRDNNNPER